ncbi:circularly permuted type 2 ATP-grasp protein [Phaeobacter marinintestinus]|uniref:circularly permuted type 2 ATP-grasp protein n=1 Tax=Falsiphaeobacter marinintestinus TaxID=1492905 RepID=UPI0011B8096C|nr:circularly permuted type 2 ATP-grasp protein [Phaeobacter marinintestinus]
MGDADPVRSDAVAALLAAYRPQPGIADELLQPDGQLRPVWAPLIDLLAGQTPEQIARRFARGDQYLHDAGVYYRQYTGTVSTERDWPLSHVPVVISSDEWAGLTQGIVQRAELLERVMADLYGPGDLVSRGLLPAELVARNPEWLRPMVGIKPASGHFLHSMAFEIGRAPDGRWFVLGDRAQAPSGAGFAIENRMATARVFADHYPDANVERLAGFFRAFRDTLTAPRSGGWGHAAILTPGQQTDTYFEHAYLARYLGLMLLEGEDLKVQGDRLMVRTVNGPEPIGALWRRLDSRFADPLELFEGSALGTPGMVGALRNEAVMMVNALGSGVLEARALMAFLPRICRDLLGAPLALPNIATWWCGQPQAREYVMQNLPRMMIGRALTSQLPFETDSLTVIGGAGSDAVGDWLTRDGASFVGQEAVTLSTTPAMIDGKLAPRPMLVRVFAVRTDKGWTVMPGGYARIGRTEDPTALTMQNGGSVADVWVVGDTPVEQDSLRPAVSGPFVRGRGEMLPSRAADNLFWLGRNVERSEAHLRQMRAYHLRWAESDGRMTPILSHMQNFMSGTGIAAEPPISEALTGILESSLGCAGKVRDRFSQDGWMALRDLADTARDFSDRVQPGDDAARAMWVLLRKLAGFAGLADENMYHSAGWRFLTIGRALERADFVVRSLIEFVNPDAPPGSLDVALELGDSVLSHRQRYAMQTSPLTVLDLLALDPDNPRSILSQISAIRNQNALLPKALEHGQMSDVSRRILQLHTSLAVAKPAGMTPEQLHHIRGELLGISDDLTALYLS